MAGPTVFEDVVDDVMLDGYGQLFAGKKFWVAQRVPSRAKLLDDITANGGEIVLLEKKADYRIADHFRKDCPPGSISYVFVRKSIEDGQLRDPADHPAGPAEGQARAPGDLHQPPRSGKTAYTTAEDRILYKWVRDAVAAGGSASGNEIYKQLEQKYPRHTWQSWRDHYIKQLKNRPPSAFDTPDNADQPPAPTQRAAATPKTADKVAGQGKVRDTKPPASPDYTIDQLAAMFDPDDWDELYAYVHVIDASRGQSSYTSAWNQWAKSKDNQTAEQWRQYYEKVVRPQWLRDPESKHTQIKEKVEKRHQQDASQSQSDEQPEEAPEPTLTTSATEPSKPLDEQKLMSSSTAQHESPKHIAALGQNVLKRARRDDENISAIKRPRNLSPMENVTLEAKTTVKPRQMIEVHSDQGSPSDDEDESVTDQVNEPIKRPIEQSQHDYNVKAEGEEPDEDVESIEHEEDIELDQSPTPPEGLGEASEDELPSNTPTPRPIRQRPNNFDTQDILSSPSQDLRVSRLPRPVDLTQATDAQSEQRSSSLAPHLDSDASTTQSLQEFRRSLNSAEPTQLSDQRLAPLARAPSFSPTPSNSSATSEDPDPPLSGNEIMSFFAAQNAAGFSDAFVSSALKRTGCRPDLAETVLYAWSAGEPLPYQRGIWSLEDDRTVEGGDGADLARLERKHTLDGWGGITERLKFLDGYRSR
ncbi:hypothetical protein ACEQ8H_003474 [Pleosporales sp. CAS-2024a]